MYEALTPSPRLQNGQTHELPSHIFEDSPAGVFEPRDNNRRRFERQRFDVMMATQASHVDEDVPTQSIELPPEFFVLSFKLTKIKKTFTRIRDIWPQIVSADIGSKSHTLDSKTSSVMKLKNAARC